MPMMEQRMDAKRVRHDHSEEMPGKKKKKVQRLGCEKESWSSFH
jgi:hypothetical protein